MKYREKERMKAVMTRDAICQDPGGGEYNKINRNFILLDPYKNFWFKIRKEAPKYFKDNNIVWWPGGKEPSGHLLSSQIACVNHLFFLRNDQQSALKFLKNINKDFVEVCADFESGYIGFEVVSKGSYLGEGIKQTRGANCTSVDAMMAGKLANGKKIQVLIEWKYTEYYSIADQSVGDSGNTRKSRYDNLIKAPDSPFNGSVTVDNYYYEPFYQLMRQTLLAWQMVKHKNDELHADEWIHLDVIPETNLHLRYQVTAPGMDQSGVEDAWKAVLKEPEKYAMITPQKLLKPFIFDKNFGSLVNYLNKRYW